MRTRTRKEKVRTAARDKHILLGRILRVNPDGTTPADNLLLGPSSDPCGVEGRATENGLTRPGNACQETFASGLRNPFRMAFDPNTRGPQGGSTSFRNEPVNLRLRVNGESLGAPTKLRPWDGYKLNISAPRRKDRAGRTWVFRSWSDGGPRDHFITTPDVPSTYTATFKMMKR